MAVSTIKFSTQFPVGLPKWLFGRDFADLDWHEIGTILVGRPPSLGSNIRKYMEFKTATWKTVPVKGYSKGGLTFSCEVSPANSYLNIVKSRDILDPDLSFCIERDTDQEKMYFIGRTYINNQMRLTVDKVNVMKGSYGIHLGKFDFTISLSTDIFSSHGDKISILDLFRWIEFPDEQKNV